MSIFSIPTAYLMVSLVYLLMPSITWVVLAKRRSAAITLWCIGGVGMGIAFQLVGLRGTVPAWATFPLANLLIFTYIMFRSQALRLDQSRPWRTGTMLVAAVVFMSVFEVLRLGLGNLLWLVQYDQLIYTCGLTYLATLAYHIGQQEQSRSAYWIAGVYLLAASATLFQVITNALGWTAPGELSGLTSSVIAVVGLLVAMVSHIAYMGLVLERSRRETAAIREQAAERYQTLLSTSSDGFWLVDAPTGRLLDANAAASRMSGYAREELLSMHISDLDLHDSAEDVERRAAAITRQGWALFETQHKTRDHRIIDVEVSTSFDPETQTFVAFLRDITDRKHYEQTLQQARDAANAANVAKSQFLAHMSHEIRSPMNGVLGMAQLLEREHLSAEQHEMVQHLRASGKSLLSIINDILDFSKMEAGQLKLERQPFDLAQTLAHIASMSRVAAAAKGIGLRLDLAPGLSGCWLGDALRLEQVLSNLVGNAIKFTAQGEVVIVIQPTEPSAAQTRLRFAVKDTGIGMDADCVAQLFTPFNQADSSIARRFGGTGLGLAISKRLVELMGGNIGVTSLLGQGSVFWFELSLERVAEGCRSAAAEFAVPTESATGVTPPPRLTGLRVLIVDDSAINRMLVNRALKLDGAITTEAIDGQQALQTLQANPHGFDVVLMDIQMPVMDGLTATRLIRENAELHGLPVIALTAGVIAEERERALAAGVNDFLAKPLDLEKLVAMLRPYAPVGDATPRPTIAATLPGAPAADTPSGFPVIPGIDTARVERLLGNDRAYYLRLLGLFVEEFADLPAQLRADLAQGDLAAAARRVHNLKGNAGNLGALALMAAANTLESALPAQAPDRDAQIERIGAQLDTLIEAIRPWLVQAPSRASGTPQ